MNTGKKKKVPVGGCELRKLTQLAPGSRDSQGTLSTGQQWTKVRVGGSGDRDQKSTPSYAPEHGSQLTTQVCTLGSQELSHN